MYTLYILQRYISLLCYALLMMRRVCKYVSRAGYLPVQFAHNDDDVDVDDVYSARASVLTKQHQQHVAIYRVYSIYHIFIICAL